jgi:hypothetical protein
VLPRLGIPDGADWGLSELEVIGDRFLELQILSMLFCETCGVGWAFMFKF